MIRLILLVTMLSAFIFAPKISLAATALNCARTDLTAKEQIQCGACDASGATTCDPGTSTSDLSGTIRQVINVLSVLAGAVAVVMIIVGGFRYITSAGNAEATKNARNTIVYALVGLIIIAMAQIIVHFVLNNTVNTASNSSGTTTGQAGTAGGADTSAARQ